MPLCYQDSNIHLSKSPAEILANEIKNIIIVIPKRKFDLNPSDTNEDLFLGFIVGKKKWNN